MELPVQLKFFRKLELYQELRSQDKNFSHGNENFAWEIEKDILQWTVRNHHHLGTPLTETHASDPKNRILKPEKYSDPGSLKQGLSNLIQRGFATQDPSVPGIHFTKEGLLMGEVINDVRQGCFLSKKRYQFFYWTTWLIVAFGVLLLFANLVKVILDIYSQIARSTGHAFHLY